MYDDFILKVKCPNNGSECSVVGGEIMESMVLLGDGEQNMQCLACGYASNSNMKTNIQPFPKDFKEVVDENILKWRIFAHQDPKTEVIVPLFSDAFKMVEKLEKALGETVQQQTNN